MRTINLAKKIAQLTLTKKAHDVVLMDLRKVTDMADFFIVCTGDSDVQVRAIAEAIEQGTEQLGLPAWHREGKSQGQWVLLDYVDIVVHVFHKDVRGFYAIEKLWNDAKIEAVEDEEAKTKAKKAAVKPKPKASPKKKAVRKQA